HMGLINYTNEYERLTKVALYRPSIEEIYQGDPQDVMYVSHPNPQKVLDEFDGIAHKFTELGVEVVLLEDTATNPEVSPNMIFLRDTAAAIGSTLVLASMKHEIRKNEPAKLQRLLLQKDPYYAEHFLKL